MEQQINLSEVKGVVGGPSVDLSKYDKKVCTIESAEILKVPSKYTALIEGTQEHQKQWVLKVQSGILESVGEGEDKIDFRVSELFNLLQDSLGKLIGFPKGDSSNLTKFLRDLKIDVTQLDNLQQVVDTLKGKESLIKAYDKEIDGHKKTFLKFRY